MKSNPATLVRHIRNAWHVGAVQKRANQRDRLFMICTPVTAYGGGQQYLYRILEAMRGRYNVFCVSPFLGEETGSFQNLIEHRGGACSFFDKDKKTFSIIYAAYLFGFRPKVVHINGCNSVTPLLMAFLLMYKLLFKAKLCMTQHLKFFSEKTEKYIDECKKAGNFIYLFNQKWAMRTYRKIRYILKPVDKIIFVNHEYKHRYEDLFNFRENQAVSVINGVDFKKFNPDVLGERNKIALKNKLGIAAGDFLVLGVGNLIVQKRFDIFIEVITALVEKGYSVKGLIVGIGPLEKELRGLVEKKKVAGAILFAGYRSDIPQLLNVGDCLLMTSGDEGLPYILLEARATGLPTVVSAVGGNKEVICHGVDGYLVDITKIDEIVDSLEMLIQSHDLRQLMSCKGRIDTAKRFDLKIMQKKTLDVFYGLGLSKSEVSAHK